MKLTWAANSRAGMGWTPIQRHYIGQGIIGMLFDFAQRSYSSHQGSLVSFYVMHSMQYLIIDASEPQRHQITQLLMDHDVLDICVQVSFSTITHLQYLRSDIEIIIASYNSPKLRCRPSSQTCGILPGCEDLVRGTNGGVTKSICTMHTY